MPSPAVLNVGFYNFVMTDKIVALVSSESAPMRRVVQNLRKTGQVIDATQGRRTKAILFMSDQSLVLSAISQETLVKRLATGEIGADDADKGRGGFFRQLVARFERDIGIDLGTANTLVHVAGRGIVLREPSVVAINKDTGESIWVGEEAKRMLGRTPANIVATRPLKDGVIADYDQTEAMLRYFIQKVSKRSTFRMNVVVGIPSGVTEVERRAVIQAAERSGATRAYVIEEPMAAAFGAGLPVDEPSGSMIVDIGGGTTEVAVISLGGIVHSRSVRIAGDELDEAIIAYVRRAYNLFIGERTAEQCKIEIGSAYPLEQELEMVVKGRDLVTGLPRSAVISSEEVRLAIAEPLNAIVEAVKLTLEATPPGLAADAMDRGITLAGGGALLRGLDQLINQETLMPVHIAKDPLSCVALGTGIVVEGMHENTQIRRMLEKSSRP